MMLYDWNRFMMMYDSRRFIMIICWNRLMIIVVNFLNLVFRHVRIK